jgi:hypothetical protein
MENLEAKEISFLPLYVKRKPNENMKNRCEKVSFTL